MKTRGIITGGIVVLFAAATGWQVIAQGPDGPSAPANVTEASAPETGSPPPPASAPSALRSRPPRPALRLRGLDDRDARSPKELEKQFQSLDEQAAKTVGEIRELLSTHKGPYAPREYPQLLSSLRSTVARLFEIRQQLQRRELAEYQSRLARIGQQIEDRESLKDAIIDRRVEELINPALAWEPTEAADSSPKKIGGGAAPPTEAAVPQGATDSAPPSDEETDPKARLREQFVSQFPGTLAPDVAGKHRDTLLDHFVDTSPDRTSVVTIRPVDKRSYTVALWDFETGRPLAVTEQPGTAAAVRFSANGQFIGVKKFLANEVDVFEVPIGNTVHTLMYEEAESWEDAFNCFAEELAGSVRDAGGAATPNVDGTVLSVDNQRELGIISLGSEDGMRLGMTLHVFQGATYLGRVTVVKTNQNTSLVRIEEENAAMPIRRGDRVIAAASSEAMNSVPSLAWNLLGAKLKEHGPVGRFAGGMEIQELRPQGPAANAELRVGDVLVGLNDWETKTFKDLGFALEQVRPHPEQTREVKALAVRDGETVSATLTIAAPKVDDGAATSPAETEEFAVRGSVHVLFKSPRDATISWTPRSADGRSLFRTPPGLKSGGARKTLPASFVGAHGQRVPFHLRDIPGRDDLRLFGSVEIAPLSEAIFPFVASSAIPVEFTKEDLDRASSGEQVVKLIWVNADDGVTVVSNPHLDPGADPVDEAQRRGVELRRDQVLAILRLQLDPTPPIQDGSSSSWPLFRGGSPMTGVASTPLPDDLSLRWSFRAENGGFESTAAIAGGVAFLGDRNGALYALDTSSGEKLWHFQIEDDQAGFNAAPAVRNGLIYLGDTAGKLYCLDAGDGTPVWSYQTGGEINGGANFHRENVLVGSQDGTLYCLNGKTGELVWKHVIGEQIRSTPTIAGDRGLLAGCDGRLHIIDLERGDKIAEAPLDGPTGVTPAASNDRVYLGTESGVFFAVDGSKGEAAWKWTSASAGQPIRSSAAVGDNLVLFGADRRLYALDTATGEERWSFLTRGKVASSPVIAGGRAYFGSNDGRVYGVDLASGEKAWEHEVGGRLLGSPAVADGKMIIASDEGVVYCFGAKDPVLLDNALDAAKGDVVASLSEPLAGIAIDASSFAGDFQVVDVAPFQPDEFEIPGPHCFVGVRPGRRVEVGFSGTATRGSREAWNRDPRRAHRASLIVNAQTARWTVPRREASATVATEHIRPPATFACLATTEPIPKLA